MQHFLGQINCFTVSDSVVYLGTTNGVYSGNMISNLKDPNNWTLEIADFNDEITSMQLTIENLFFTTPNKIYNYEIYIYSFI